jgi:lipoyl(octanoyl) transferase
MTSWTLLKTGPGIGAYNMAVDQELLARAQAGETRPILRLYAWDPPAVSLGRFQKIGNAVDVEACKKHGIDIVRRCTGGRAVLHGKELTYSVVARTDNPLFPSSILGTYKVIAACLIAGFRNLGIHAEMAPRGDKQRRPAANQEKDPSCFSSPSWYEIVVNNRKIAGSAQRRLSNAFLQHGSILLDFDPALEAEVIPGTRTTGVVTSMKDELGHTVSFEDAQVAFIRGFAETMRIDMGPQENFAPPD